MLVQLLMLVLVATAYAFAEPQTKPRANDRAITTVLVSTVFGTVTLNMPVTIPTTISSTPGISSSTTRTTYTATQLYAYREDSPIHLLPMQARGQYFQLGGLPTTACPSVHEACPPGEITGVNQCELSVVVAGGQQIYLKPDGSLRFTATHSVSMPPRSIQCPLNFTSLDSDISEVSIQGFGATGFMACPMINSTRVPEQWQVYANLPNASVPLPETSSSLCLEFDALGVKIDLGDSPAAYGYV